MPLLTGVEEGRFLSKHQLFVKENRRPQTFPRDPGHCFSNGKTEDAQGLAELRSLGLRPHW